MNIFTQSLTLATLSLMMSLPASAQIGRRTLVDSGSHEYKTSGITTLFAPAPEETWKDIGEGVLRDDLFTVYYIIDYEEFPVKIQESEQIPGRYRLVNAWSKFPLLETIYPSWVTPKEEEDYVVIDASDPAHVRVEQGLIGAYIGEYLDDEGNKCPQECFIWSQAADYKNQNTGGLDEETYERVCGKLRNGAITFPANALLLQAYEGVVDAEGRPVVGYSWSTWNRNGQFRLLLPDAPDVDVAITLGALDDGGTGVEYSFVLDDDVAFAKAALVCGEDISSIAKGIIEGSISSIEIKENGVYSFPYEGDGVFSLVAVPYLSDGTPCYESSLTRMLDFDQSVWRKVGKGSYTEAVLSSNEMNKYGFTINEYTYDVDIEANVDNPGLIRMVDPYGAAYPNSSPGNYDYSRKYYIEIDATNPSKVFLNKTEDFIGINFGYGPMMIWSRAARSMINDEISKDELYESNPEFFGKAVDNVITFSKGSLILNFTQVRPDTWYDANQNGRFRLEVPGGIIPSGIDGVETDVYDGEEQYFTVSGIKINAVDATDGVYIVRKGSEVRKIIVRK